ncbi:hypothetical protein ABLE93_03235 [Xanthobacter sp. KR7-65]|uniref:hypothetical protein n=1 Tax=Xanthobacter sp. KR7-65 TaxID=3156612 RepID=UPI0032B5B975
MAKIEVRQSAGGEPLKFAVVVRDDAGETQHVVTMAPANWQELTAGAHTPVKCVEAAFRFLLDREAKEQILARFDMATVAYYYPDFPRQLPSYLSPT